MVETVKNIVMYTWPALGSMFLINLHKTKKFTINNDMPRQNIHRANNKFSIIHKVMHPLGPYYPEPNYVLDDFLPQRAHIEEY